ncbi:FUSC family protein [Novosphingobium sp. SG707]|uniref:FUSC family protein n=1 Tax=Novosphingobium sp. SG707 TaxID=2586996 RepID=UPI0014459640|nr:FUSC family protein [Novosphingobium sp. SG707]NKI98226.1 putative membrane protein [Novosphingobium sp. SG707]
MASLSPSQQLSALARREWAELSRVNSSPRPWQMPFMAGVTSAAPVALGLWLGAFSQGLMAALGTMVFVYLTNAGMERRLLTLMAMSFAITACFALGLIAALVHFAPVPVVMVTATLVSMGCRYLRQGPPAAMFPVMACAIALFAHAPWDQIPARVGILFLGAMFAAAMGFFYSLYILRQRPPEPDRPAPPLCFEILVFEPVMIGIAAGLALGVAQALGLDKPFWAPVSAIAVIQSASMRMMWTKQMHRIIGTGLGVALAWGILSLELSHGWLAVMIGVLTFVIEVAVVRHYGFATIFITPLAILLGQAQADMAASPGAITLARLEDTVVGCFVAVAVGMVMHAPRARAWAAGIWARSLRPPKPAG